MKFSKGLLIGIICTLLFHMWLIGFGHWQGLVSDRWSQISDLDISTDNITESFTDFFQVGESVEEDPVQDASIQLESIHPTVDHLTIGMDVQELEEQLGKPNRVEGSLYGYDWWVYNTDWDRFVQVGVKEGHVVTFYTNAPRWEWWDLSPGLEYEEWQSEWQIEDELSFYYDEGYYTFSLSDKERQEKPLFIDDDLVVQLYIDVHDDQKISGIRVMDRETLLLHRPYTLKYSGSLPEQPELSATEWVEIQSAYEQQIFDMVNVFRNQSQLVPFEWHEAVAVVARGHSQDMLENAYFDHHSPTFGNLGNRLSGGDVTYLTAGENIAWNYVDAADAHHGWLNSLGHRNNIVEERFTHLGVGVIEKYYTQNFISN